MHTHVLSCFLELKLHISVSMYIGREYNELSDPWILGVEVIFLAVP